MDFLKRHPFPVVATLERVLAISFAYPEKTLQPMLPPGLELDTYDGLGFITIALVWTRNLRPLGFPAALGQDFFLAGYRIFTRFQTASGRCLRGLKIIGSETDQRRMVHLGNLMTGYAYRHVNLSIETDGTRTHVRTNCNGSRSLDLRIDDRGGDIPLPTGSPFPDWRTARRFAGPMPFTFSPRKDGAFVVVEGTRDDWTPRPIALESWQVALFDQPPLQGIAPIAANAFAVDQIPYRWQRGRIMKAGGPA